MIYLNFKTEQGRPCELMISKDIGFGSCRRYYRRTEFNRDWQLCYSYSCYLLEHFERMEILLHSGVDLYQNWYSYEEQCRRKGIEPTDDLLDYLFEQDYDLDESSIINLYCL